MEKSCRKCAPKAILKGDYQKALKKLSLFFFRTQSLLIDKVIKNKVGLELVTSHS